MTTILWTENPVNLCFNQVQYVFIIIIIIIIIGWGKSVAACPCSPGQDRMSMRCEWSYSPRKTDIAISLCMLMPLTGCMQMERVIPECTTSPYSRSRRSVKLVLYRVLVRAGRTYSLIPRSSHLDSRLFDRTAWARRRTTPFTSDHTLN